MSARPPDGATFEVSRIGRSRSRAPLAALLWTLGLAGIVAIGVFGRSQASPAPAAGEAAASDPGTGATSDASATFPRRDSRPPALGTDLALVHAIDLRLPAAGPITLNEPKLTVYGKVIVHAARIEISLEARNNRVIDSAAIVVSDPDGGIRPAQQAQFEVQFPLPYPRPNGTMWVVVTAYDALGMPLGGERRPFLVGAIIPARLRILDFRDN